MEFSTLMIVLLAPISINAAEPFYSATVSAATEVDGQCQRTVTISGNGVNDKITIGCDLDASVITTDDHLIVGDVIFSDEPNTLVIVGGSKCLERTYKDGEEASATILSDKDCSVVKKSIRVGKEDAASGGSDSEKSGFGSWGIGGFGQGGNNWWDEEFGEGGNMEDYEYGGNWENSVKKGVNDVTERLSDWGVGGFTQGDSWGNNGFGQASSLGYAAGGNGGIAQSSNTGNGRTGQITSTGNGRTGSGFDFGIGAATNLAGNVVKLGTGLASDVAGGIGNVFTSFGNVFSGNRGK